MKIFCDTSVLVARSVAAHPHHDRATVALKPIISGKDKGYISTHGAAEFYATLTGLPLNPRIHPRDAQLTLQTSILPHFQMVKLGTEEYLEAIERVSSRGLASGMIYDALHLIAAERAGVEQILTFDVQHFSLVADEQSRPLIRAP